MKAQDNGSQKVSMTQIRSLSTKMLKQAALLARVACSITVSAAYLCASATQDDKLEFTVRVDAKDNRARVSFEDLNIHSPSTYSARTPASDSKVILQNEVTAVKAMLDKTVDSLAGDVKAGSKSTNW